MRLEVSLLADDLTGALDAAAPFAACGLSVRVYRSPGALPAAPAPSDPSGWTDRAALPVRSAPAASRPGDEAAFPGLGASLRPAAAGTPSERSGGLDPPMPRGAVVAVNTSTRHLAPAAARGAVAAAGRRLLAWSPRLAFKKIDSTLRGPVADEVAAAMEGFARRSALVCPAFPAAGRVVRGGEVHVYGRPLRRTEYVRDLRTPAPAEPLEALFRRIGPVQRLSAAGAPGVRPPPGVTLADAETEAHLADLAARVLAHPDEVLAVGSDGLAAGLAGLLGAGRRTVRLAGRGGGVVLFAIGSRAGTAAKQVERLRQAYPDVPVVEAPRGRLEPDAALRAAAASGVVLACVPPSPSGDPAAIARTFGAAVRTVLGGLDPVRRTALVATGGDTVEAILDALGVAVLDVLGEFRAGVPVSRPAEDGPALTLVSKAGGFGSPDLFAEIVFDAAGPRGA